MLEDVEGVRAVYSVVGGRSPHDFVVELDNYIAMVAAHYALLRVLTHEECERVRMLTPGSATGPGRGATRLTLDHGTREALRARIPPPPPRPILEPSRTRPSHGHILVVDKDPSTATFVRDAFGLYFSHHSVANASEGLFLAQSSYAWCLMLVDYELAFGRTRLVKRVPPEHAQRVVVLADAEQIADARRQFGDWSGVLLRPLSRDGLYAALVRAIARSAKASVAALPPEPQRRPLTRSVVAPAPDAPIRVLLVGRVDGEFDVALGRILGREIEFVVKTDVDEAIAYAFSNPISVMISGPHRSFIDGVALEDDAAARRIIVAAPARDLFRVRDELALRSHHNRVVALPLEEESLRAALLDLHPDLAFPPKDAGAKVMRPAYRRIAALVVDEDASTQILFSAGMSIDDTDVALETTSLAAFEHVLSRPVDVLFVSTSLRSDGGEPFYRSLWRMKPELKACTVLVTAPDTAPPSARDTKLPRILERPVSRARLAAIVAAFRAAQ